MSPSAASRNAPVSPRYRLAEGWVACAGPGELVLAGPNGRRFRLELDDAGADRLLDALRRGRGVTTELAELVSRLAELGVAGSTPDGSPLPEPLDVVTGRDAPRWVGRVLDSEGLTLRDPAGPLVAPVLVVAAGLDDPVVVRMNQRILAEDLTALLVMVAGWSVSVGPVIAPAGGGPCLVCLQERYRATVQAAIDWSRCEPVRVVTVGTSPPEQDAVRFALRLARRVACTAQGLPAGMGGALTTMQRVALDTCEVQRLSCHPVPWCPACGQTTGHRLIRVDR